MVLNEIPWACETMNIFIQRWNFMIEACECWFRSTRYWWLNMELNQYLENMATNTNLFESRTIRSALELHFGVRSCLQDHLSGPIFRNSGFLEPGNWWLRSLIFGFRSLETRVLIAPQARSLKINAKAPRRLCIGPGKSLERNPFWGTNLISSFFPTIAGFRIGFDRFSSLGRPSGEN